MNFFIKGLQNAIDKAVAIIDKTQSKSRLKRGLLKIRKLTEKKDDAIEKFAKENALYTSKEWKISPVIEFLEKYKLELIGEGSHVRAYKIVNEQWVVKEARWDLKMDLFGNMKLPLPIKLANSILKLFAVKFLPDKEFIQEDYHKYLQFTQYFGYFEKEEDFPNQNREMLFSVQKNVRTSLLAHKEAIEKYYKFTLDSRIDEILNSKLKYTNFLPREYQLIGKSYTPDNNQQTTSFIFQRFVPGDLLCDVPEGQMTKRLKKQLILMMYLILLMNMQIHIVPDTRPRHPMFQAYNWLLKTDNIIVQNNKVYFIDTRWFWESKAGLLKRGIFITGIVINNCKVHINKLLNDL